MFPLNVIAAAGNGGTTPPVQIQHTLVAAIIGPTFGYQDADSVPGIDGSFTPNVSSGIKIVRLVYGGDISTVTFGMEGQFRPDNDNSWRQIRATGVFQGGQNTHIFVRANANAYTPDFFLNETAWGFGPTTDGFINGNSYQVFIDDRIG